ncbi:MAG: cupin domain-containing protein [Paraburkholderia sp.]|uniref:cupin domain-containing protein n=1 Tax=Paraburkholderia sp. TaxID=1926495 RepID=UPI003C4209D8
MERPEFIRHWTELEDEDNAHYKNSTELLGIGAPLAQKLGLQRIGIHHLRLPPGRRSSYPHAESAEEEFVFVIEGTPDVWIDGHLYRLAPGDSVSFPAGTGICHTFMNNTDQEVRMMVIGETAKPENRIRYPMNEAHEATRPDRWLDWPARPLGLHNGEPKRNKP